MKKIICAALAVSLALSLTGCSGLTIFSNYRRIENIELVRTITADKAEDGVNVAIYGTAGEESEARMYEKTGPSIGVAMGELILMPLGREGILSHTEAMLIGEDLARESIDDCMDYVERFSETRLDTGILVVRDGTARDLLAGLSGEDTPASDIIAGLNRNISKIGEGYFFTCREIASSLANNDCAIVQCVRGQKEEKLFDARGDLNLQPAGFAIIRGNKVTDFLTDQETLGTMLTLGRFKSKNVDLEIENAAVTVSVDLVKSDIKPVFDKNGALQKLNADFEFRANVISMDGSADILDSRVRGECEEKLNGIMTDAIRAAIKKGQELGVDYLDLEGIVLRDEPIRFYDMPQSWKDIFPTLRVDISGKSVLARTYDITDPPELSGRREGQSPWERLTESLKDS